MRLTRLVLRNYRVFANRLELELPAGLVGIYGANGAGKSCLVGAVPWALFGYSRTGNDEVRTAGVDEESLVEVEFDHEGHRYGVVRTVSGVNSTVRARAFVDGVLVSDGVRDTARYVRSVLGIDDASFRASAFAEQKQLSAFASATTTKRRDLVLRLLGITPLDAARDRARQDAKVARDDLARLRAVLPDLDTLVASAGEATDAERAATLAAAEAGAALSERRRQLAVARRHHDDWTVRAAEHEALVAEGREVRRHDDAMVRRIDELRSELAGLDQARRRLDELGPRAEGLAAVERRLEGVAEVERAATAVAACATGPAPPEPDDAGVERLRVAAEHARQAMASHRALTDELRRHRDQAAVAAAESAGLSGEAGCPMCGQELGAAFEEVRAHRRLELEVADARLAESLAQVAALELAAEEAATGHRQARGVADEARQQHAAWQQGRSALRMAEQALEEARCRLDGPVRADECGRLRAEVELRRQAAAECQRLAGLLERGPRAEVELRTLVSDRESVRGRLDALREKVRGLGFSPAGLVQARNALDCAGQAEAETEQRARRAEQMSARATARAEAAHAALAAARDQHATLVDLGDRARHLGRLAELLQAFRNQLIGAVGPRLSSQAASLFAELTDAEYDELRVDPDTYGIDIVDHGVAYGLDRFSGSETDLACLALRVAISEHLGFQSGGHIGLLVLDEVFGPLDTDRTDRMLRALERLRGRFGQVLVVTHDTEVKDQLPNAIEVLKLGGRRATARVVAAG